MHSLFLGDITIYWIINLFLFAVILFCSYNISYLRNNQSFRLYALIIIVFYAIIEGLRWDRGVDYYGYYLAVTGEKEAAASELGYALLLNIWQTLCLPYWSFFMFCSGLYIASFLSVIRHYSYLAIWALPICFFMTQAAAENIVRQYMAISFFLLGYSAFLRGEKRRMILCWLTVPLIHLSGIIVIAAFISAYYFEKTTENKYTGLYLTLFYIGLVLFWDTSRLSVFSNLLQNLPISDTSSQFSGYIQNADRWFSNEGSLALLNNGRVGNIYHMALTKFLNIFLIYFGYESCRKNKGIKIIYMFFCIYTFLAIIGGDIEIYKRFGHWFVFALPILSSYIIMKFPMHRVIKTILIVLSIMVYMFPWLSKIGTMPYSGCAFVWDLI